MANFKSFGEGFVPTFNAGQNRQVAQRQMDEQRKAKQEEAAAKSLQKRITDSETSSLGVADEMIKVATEAFKNGATIEQVAPVVTQGAFGALKQHAALLDEIQAMQMQAGLVPKGQPTAGAEFLKIHGPRIQAALSLGQMGRDDPEQQGFEQGTERVAEAEAIAERLGVPVNQVAEAMGIVPKDTTAADMLALDKRLNERTQEALKTEAGLRRELSDLVKDYFEISRNFAKINAAGTNPSAAGDLSLIFNYMKMLDPGSTIREGEFANAENSGSVGQRITGLYNSIVSGERLADSQRADFLNRAKDIMRASQEQAIKTGEEFETLAIGAGVDPANVLATIRANMQDIGKNTPTPAPPAAVEHLRKNPELLDQFIQKYGEDAVPEDFRGQ